MRAEAAVPLRPSGSYLAPEDFSRFLIGVFDTLRRDRSLDFDAREIDALYLAYRRQPTGFCELSGPCLGDYFGIDPDGRVMHCDKFLSADGYVLGNVLETSFAEMRASEVMRDLHRLDVTRRARLRQCRWFDHCQGWCPHEAHIAALRGSEGECCGLSAVFKHFADLEEAALVAAPYA